MKIGNNFILIRKNDCIEVWIPPTNNPKGELVCVLQSSLIPSLVAELRRFEQSEGRK